MKRTFLSLLLSLFVALNCFSQIDSISLEEVIVTASPSQTNTQTIQSIKPTEVGKIVEPTTLLQYTPSIVGFSENGNNQGYSYLRIRGVDQTRINFSIDGIPLNDAEDYGVYLSNFGSILNGVSNISIDRGATFGI